MPGLKFNQFGGMLPRANPVSRSSQVAAMALDVNLDQGTLSPWRERLVVSTATQGTEVLSFAQVDCCWLTSEACVKFVVPWPSCRFVVRAGAGAPFYASFENACADDWCPLGIPCPSEAPAAFATDPPVGAYPPTTARKDFETRHYRYAWVNVYGHESGGSAPSAFVNTFDGSPVTVYLPNPPPGYCIDRLRLYRTGTPLESGGEKTNPPNTEWFLVEELPVGVNVYSDGRPNIDLLLGQSANATFHGDERLPAPDDLTSVVTLENGMMAGISPSTNMIVFSEPFLPTSWPMRYRKTLWQDDVPVALSAIGPALYVATTGHPYTITVQQQQQDGRHGVFRHRESLPCISARSFVAGSGACYYASHDGLVALSATQARVISETVMSKRQWQSWRPNRLLGVVHDGHYFGFSDPLDSDLAESGVHGFRLKTAESEHADAETATLTVLSDNPDAVWLSDRGGLYMVEDGIVSKWNAGAALRPYLWRNTTFYWARRTALGAGYVTLGEPGPVMLTVLTDRGNHVQTILGGRVFRMPNWMSVADTQIELTGTGEVAEFVLGTSYKEAFRAGANV
jgi:hypothetical protein